MKLLLSFVLGKQRVSPSGISFQGRGPQTRISRIAIFKCIFLSSRKNFYLNSQVTPKNDVQDFEVQYKRLLCFNKFEAAIYESFMRQLLSSP